MLRNLSMPNRKALPTFDQITPETPLRLAVAAALAFPDGSVTASALRRERDRGRLIVERIANKEYTTLSDIKRMRQLCRENAKEPDSGCPNQERTAVMSGDRCGSSSTAADNTPQAVLRTKLQKLSES
jgi:hypothetical protein